MSKIRFIGDIDKIYDVIVNRIGQNQLRIIFKDNNNIPIMKVLLSGFDILNEYTNDIMTNYRDYMYIYRDTNINNIYELCNDNVSYVEPIAPIVPEKPDDDNKEEPEEIIPSTMEMLSIKLKQLSEDCRRTIEDGVTVKINGNNEHFSYNLNNGDQNNIDDIIMYALYTGYPQYYHNDNGSCKLYSVNDIISIYSAQKANKLDNLTYYNQLCLQLKERYADKPNTKNCQKEINNLVYKNVPLEGDYYKNYCKIMKQGAILVNIFNDKIKEIASKVIIDPNIIDTESNNTNENKDTEGKENTKKNK